MAHGLLLNFEKHQWGLLLLCCTFLEFFNDNVLVVSCMVAIAIGWFSEITPIVLLFINAAMAILRHFIQLIDEVERLSCVPALWVLELRQLLYQAHVLNESGEVLLRFLLLAAAIEQPTTRRWELLIHSELVPLRHLIIFTTARLIPSHFLRVQKVLLDYFVAWFVKKAVHSQKGVHCHRAAYILLLDVFYWEWKLHALVLLGFWHWLSNFW